jgi:glutaredoxin
MQNKTECPQCLGTKQVMTAKQTKGFEYKECKLCDENGLVEQEIADDYIFAMSENNFDDDFETNDDW